MYELCYPTAMRRIINGRREPVWEGESSSGAARLMQETPTGEHAGERLAATRGREKKGPSSGPGSGRDRNIDSDL